MQKTIKIEKLYFKDFTSKTGQPLTRLSVLAQGAYYKGLKAKWNESWAIGQTVTFEYVETEYTDKNGVIKKSLNLVAPKSVVANSTVDLSSVNKKLDDIYSLLQNISSSLVNKRPTDEPPFIDDQDIPF